MKKVSLCGSWILDIPGTSYQHVPATVPGSVYTDLLTNHLIEDPFYGANENEALKLMENDFCYSRTFEIPEDLLSCDQVLLRAEGLDTIADISVNGKAVAHTENMHRIWEFDVRDILKAGENEICVRFSSPTRYIREAYEKNPAEGSSDAMTGFPLIRKAHCMYGWDWGPHLPDAGIWKEISIIGVNTARIRDVRIHQIHENGAVACQIFTHVTPADPLPLADLAKLAAKPEYLQAEVCITAPDGSVAGKALVPLSSACFAEKGILGAEVCIAIENPQLWWPNGFGSQPLYTVSVSLVRDDAPESTAVECLDTWSARIGLRTLTMNREKDEWGEKFCPQVNGVDIFAMGADYIPEDNLLPRVTPERTRRLLEDAKAANMNSIRVWGGGYYPSDAFYDSCDELGLLVWEDFMFACAVYNLTEEFEQNIRPEFVDNIRRLRHHPSLALWCGNNEMEMFVAQREWVLNDLQVSDYVKMYEYIIPQVLKEEDPDTFYWPASPSSGGAFDDPNDENRGDVHYWQVWHGLKPFTDYRKYYFRYASEFGFQSFPCMETIRSFAAEEDLNPFSYVMEKHQRNASANGKITEYLSQLYLNPSNFDLFVYASQLLQAQAIQYGVEHWRRNRGRCMGAIVWQLNDCWPVTSWASIDYFGRWKALHYAEKRFFAPVMISCAEEGILTQNTNVNAEPFDLKKTAQLAVTNESMVDFTGTAHWALRRPDASIIKEGTFPVSCAALSSEWLPLLDFHDEDTYGVYFSYELYADGADAAAEPVSSGAVLFCPPKHFHFADPKLTVRREGDEIVVSASAYARFVEIQAGADTVLSDNFFDMNAGERRVRICRGEVPEQLSVRSVYDIR